ncbi:MAG: leucine-rich repeat domain-containing protein, partial [Clostridia bacterium]|nr:leucine-rich repeat domain-containing protein [Clostridia bacterium]
MKKLTLSLLILTIVLFAFGCNDPIPEEHSHTYGEWTVETAPTCLAEGEETRVCSCGLFERRTIPVGDHTYVNNTCTTCGCQPNNEGLTYKLSSDGTSYIVVGLESACADLVIPSTYRGKPVTEIGSYAFQYCKNLVTVTISEGVTAIRSGAFYNCQNMTAITIPNSVNIIENGAFSYCERLSSVTLPDSVSKIGNELFRGCEYLTSFTFGKNVTSIGERAFYDCKRLTTIVIPDQVT